MIRGTFKTKKSQTIAQLIQISKFTTCLSKVFLPPPPFLRARKSSGDDNHDENMMHISPVRTLLKLFTGGKSFPNPKKAHPEQFLGDKFAVESATVALLCQVCS